MNIRWNDPHTYITIALVFVFWPLAIAYGMWRSHVRATAALEENKQY